MEDYKNEIRNTRVGCLGSSDATMLARIANAGSVPKSAYKRLAVCKGLIPYEETPINVAMAFGDFIENEIYKNVALIDDRHLSNPMWVSKRYSRNNVKLITHPDIVLFDDKKKTLYIYEVKTTKDSVLETKYFYRAQMYVHYIIGKEMVEDKKWRIKVYLLHYDTNGLDLEQGAEFEPERLTKSEVRFPFPVFDVENGMNIVSDFLNEMDEYYDGDEIDESYLPEKVREKFDSIAIAIAEIKERENKIDDFKQTLYSFMCDKDIKSIRGENFTITRIDPTKTVTTDYKAVFEQEIAAKTPFKAKKLALKYCKTINKKGYVAIKEKIKKNDK